MSRFRAFLAAFLLIVTCVSVACSAGSRKKQPPTEGEYAARVGQPGTAPAPASDSGPVSEGEPLLALYDDLSRTFAEHAADCTKMRDVTAAVMERHKPAIQEWGVAMVMLNPSQAEAAYARMRAVSGARLDAFDASLKQAQSKCGAQLGPLLDGVKPAGKPKP